MKKSLLILIIIASALTLAGLLIMTASFAFNGFEFKNISLLGEYEISPNEHPIFVEFKNIEIKTSSQNISVLPSPDGKARVVANETKKLYCTVELSGDTLKVQYVDTRMWFDMVGVQFGSTELTLYLPEGDYENLKLSTSSAKIKCDSQALTFKNAELTASSGDIEFSANVTDGLSVKASSGKAELWDMSPVSLAASSSSGKVELSNVTVKDSLDIKTTSGSIEFDKCDAQEMILSTSSGSIHGTLLSDKLFEVSSGSGSISVPASVSDCGKCTVSTSSGNIKLSIAK